jgi:hypothetical protein
MSQKLKALYAGALAAESSEFVSIRTEDLKAALAESLGLEVTPATVEDVAPNTDAIEPPQEEEID